MPDAPERIFHWVGQNTRTRIEYVRADLFNAQREELERLKTAALNVVLEMSLRSGPLHPIDAYRLMEKLEAATNPANPAQEGDDA